MSFQTLDGRFQVMPGVELPANTVVYYCLFNIYLNPIHIIHIIKKDVPSGI